MAHSVAHPGLQAHSIGDSYPFSVVLIGDRKAEVRNLISGEGFGIQVRGQGEDELEFLRSIHSQADKLKQDAIQREPVTTFEDGCFYVETTCNGHTDLDVFPTEEVARGYYDRFKVATLYRYVPRWGFQRVAGKHQEN